MLSAEATKTTEANSADPAAETRAVDATKTAESTANSSDTSNCADPAAKSSSQAASAKSTAKPAAHCLVRRVTQTRLSLVSYLRWADALFHVLRRRAGC